MQDPSSLHSSKARGISYFFLPLLHEPITGTGTRRSWSINNPASSDDTFVSPMNGPTQTRRAITPAFSRFPQAASPHWCVPHKKNKKNAILCSGEFAPRNMIHDLGKAGCFLEAIGLSALMKRPVSFPPLSHAARRNLKGDHLRHEEVL